MKIWTDKNYPIIISCAKGLSCWTEIEVRDMGYKPIEVTENTVVVRGAMRDVTCKHKNKDHSCGGVNSRNTCGFLVCTYGKHIFTECGFVPNKPHYNG